MININLPCNFAEINIIFGAMGFTTEQIRTALKKIRKSKGYTQAEVGEKLGVSAQQYTNLEGGSSEFSLPQFLNVLEFLEISWLDLAFMIEPSINMSEFELLAIKAVKEFAEEKIKELENKTNLIGSTQI
jgi:transcriptional regulator with XRE-family HTH domain